MPREALSLALAASIYPPALAAVIALGRGTDVRLRVVLFVLAAFLTVLVTGAIMLLLFGANTASREAVVTPGAAAYLAAGLVLVVIAARLRRTRREPKKQSSARSRTERYLGSRRLVVALGIVLYVVPSPIFAGAVNEIADTQASAGQELLWLVEMLLVMLWLIEVPMLALLVFPHSALAGLETINSWFARRGRGLATFLCAGLGVYLLVVGAVELWG